MDVNTGFTLYMIHGIRNERTPGPVIFFVSVMQNYISKVQRVILD